MNNEIQKYEDKFKNMPDEWINLIRSLPRKFQIINTYHLLTVPKGMELSCLFMDFVGIAQKIGYDVDSDKKNGYVHYYFELKQKNNNFKSMDQKANQLNDNPIKIYKNGDRIL